MSDLVSCTFKFPDMLGHYKAEFKRILIGIASDIQFNVGMRFDNQGQYNGHERWKDLASGKNLKMGKNGLFTRQVLKGKTGGLKNSISPQSQDGQAGPQGYVKFEGDINNAVVKVGTLVKYARIHNEGGLIHHPGTANGFGRGIKIPAHGISIPRRNFTDWNKQDASNMKKFLKNLVDVLNGK